MSHVKGKAERRRVEEEELDRFNATFDHLFFFYWTSFCFLSLSLMRFTSERSSVPFCHQERICTMIGEKKEIDRRFMSTVIFWLISERSAGEANTVLLFSPNGIDFHAHTGRLFSRYWREEFIVLYEDSSMAWFKDKSRSDPEVITTTNNHLIIIIIIIFPFLVCSNAIDRWLRCPCWWLLHLFGCRLLL